MFTYIYAYICAYTIDVYIFEYMLALYGDHDYAMGIHEVCHHWIHIYIYAHTRLIVFVSEQILICKPIHIFMILINVYTIRAMFVNSNEEDLEWLMKSKLPGVC
jgi:hypothetical protein